MLKSKFTFLPKALLLLTITMLTFVACDDDDSANITNIIQSPSPERGSIVNKVLVEKYNVNELNDLLESFQPGLSAIYQIQSKVLLYKVLYNTIDSRNRPTIATGAIAVPEIDDAAPIVSYQHGTVMRKGDVPSYGSAEQLIGLALAGSENFIMSMPDYVGLGDSPGFHPYMHAESEAAASIDLLIALQTICNEEEYQYSDDLFLFGYSQGGHSTMAMHKVLERDYANQFTVTASSPMSGPYDAGGVQTDMLLSDNPFPAAYYLPYVVLSYNEAYQIVDDVYSIFKAPYDSLIQIGFDGEHGSAWINSQLPSVPKEMVNDSVFQAFSTDENHPLRVALNDNNLYDWMPQAPIRMCYCTGDQLVTYRNTEVADSAFAANGATNIETVDMGDLDHGGCVLPCFADARTWFKSFLED